ncbi:MAG: hypothetical protein KatS3mg032_0374 [Cyclobacteriaceae bacterium]|nr:MAG: hypothetical protein KatS3mg032_0374 [Cyclobacteriaceae bacterium]
MNISILNYLLEANLGLLFFYVFYYLMLRKETQFSYRRYYLLAGILLSLVFPLFQLAEVKPVPSLGENLPVHWLAEAPAATVAATQPAGWYASRIITAVYLGVTAILALRLLFQFILLIRLIRHYPEKQIIELPSSAFLAFSFFNRIFISTSFQLSDKDKERILKHEEVHRKRLHSLDILLIEVIRIFFWFNPVLPVYKKEIVQVHEFEADEAAAILSDPEPYCSLLARAALQSARYDLGNHFNNSLTLKRIAMIRTVKQSISKWKVLSTFLFASALFVALSCRDQLMDEIQQAAQTTTIAGDFPDHLKPHVERILAEHPGIKVIYIQAESMQAEKIKEINPDDILFMNVVKEGNPAEVQQVEMIVRADGALSKIAGTTVAEGDIYLVAEEAASPQGGITAYYKAIQNELNYPEEAMRNGVQGKVFVEFVVEKNGTLSHERVVKGIGSGCDEEALRVLQSVNIPWNPGRNKGEPVRSKFVIPIVFKLDNAPDGVVRQPDKPEPAAPKEETLSVVEQPASPVGGMVAFYQSVTRRIELPAEVRNRGVEGKIFVEFTVEPDGTTSDHRILKGIDPQADQAAVQALQLADVRWNPGTQRGIPVRSKLVIPITIMNRNSSATGLEPPKTEGYNMKVDFKTAKSGSKFIVEGFVYDRNGAPLANVNVVVSGTTQGTITRPDGSFRIEVDESHPVLHLSHTGYKSQQIILH